MPNHEVAAQGGGPMSVPGSEVNAEYPQGEIRKQQDSGAPVTGDTTDGSPGGPGGTESMPMDTSSQGDHSTGTGREGSAGVPGAKAEQSVPMNTTDTPSDFSTSR